MKIILSITLLMLSTFCFAAVKEKKSSYYVSWELCDQCSEPESVYHDVETKTIFISNVVGQPDKADGQGWIQKISESGKMTSTKWIEGLNAPKGMRSHKSTLYVSDIHDVLVIDIATGKILKKINIGDSKFLNDIAITNDGTIYVSDTFGSKIYQINPDGTVSVFAQGNHLEAPNGLLINGDDLIVAAWGIPDANWKTKIPGNLYKLNLKTKKKTLITKKPAGNLDGLEIDELGNYLVSDWMAGKVFSITPSGNVSVMLSGMKGSADIGYIAKQKMLIVPRMAENLITAYDLTKPINK
ncbi:MAG: SMP-30/gluconolactonase/LRE family protein [Oligoflexia bacterium]|nr:SMP-30/gluconolactonase/LRE family protein [Oligoflexia bacterium]